MCCTRRNEGTRDDVGKMSVTVTVTVIVIVTVIVTATVTVTATATATETLATNGQRGGTVTV